jgi:tetratricopeptide (TPR) repeat protein
MGSERYATAVNRARSAYPASQSFPLLRERYMDHTAGLRAIAPAIEAIQEGSKSASAQQYDQAQKHFQTALKIAPSDYTGLIMMAKTEIMLKNYDAARRHAETAQALYPTEAQSYFVTGFAYLRLKRYGAALDAFETYDKRLPGMPATIFFKGLAHEGQENREAAANAYYQYLKVDTKSDRAKYAYRRLVEWGYIQPRQ